MSPESQELEDSFQHVHAGERLPHGGDLTRSTSKEFDAFFEKLSSIEDFVLAGSPIAEQQDGEEPSAAPPPKKPRNWDAGREPPAKMEILHSADLRDRGAPEDEPVRLAQPRGGFRSLQAVRRPPRVRAAALVKVAMGGMLLFGVGLGAGWLALSLPESFGGRMAAVAERINQRAAKLEIAPSRASQHGAARGETPNAGAAAAQDTDSAAVRPIVMGAEDAEETAPAVGATQDSSQGESTVQAPGAAHAASADIASAQQVAPPLPAKEDEPSAPQQASTDRGLPAAAVPHSPRFAIQVGACHSAECVRSYRRMLSAHVGLGTIQVIERRVANTAEPVRRIQVVASTKAAAMQLRDNLSSADRHFKDAYLVTIPRAPNG